MIVVKSKVSYEKIIGDKGKKNVEKKKISKNLKSGKISIKQISSVASVEYVKWLNNPRMVMLILLFLFAYDYVIELMINAADKMDTYFMCLEPFIAMANSELLVMIIPAVFMLLISDFPKTDGNTMFYIQRVGKSNWMLGQVVFAMYAGFSYLVTIIAGTLLLSAPSAYAKNSWSTVVTSYGVLYANEKESRIASLIGGQLYNNLTPLKAFVLTLSLMFLYLVTLALMLMVSFSAGKRVVGILISYVVIGVGSSLCGMNDVRQWFFPSAHSISWLHFDEVLNIRRFGIGYSYLYFVGFIVVLFVISIIAIRRYDFAKITDMED